MSLWKKIIGDVFFKCCTHTIYLKSDFNVLPDTVMNTFNI